MMKRIESGEDLFAVIEEYTRPNRREQDPAVKAILAITRQFKRNTTEIEENIDNLPYNQQELQQCRPVLERALGLIANLLEYYQNPPVNETQEDSLANVEEKIAGLPESMANKSS